MTKNQTIVLWICRIVASLILLQTLYFKFSGHEESVMLFTKLGVEPWGRIALGCIELVVGVGLLIPRVSLLASFGAADVLSGAVMTHLLFIGIEVNGDGGQLFIMALVAFAAASGAFLLQWRAYRKVLQERTKKAPRNIPMG
jgi:putative oxidoreductase